MRTRTYAEILARQQEFGEAISIYRELLARKPEDEGLKLRIIELERLELEAAGELEGPVPDDAKLAQLAKLEALLQRVLSRKRRRRVSAKAPAKTPTEAKPTRTRTPKAGKPPAK